MVVFVDIVGYCNDEIQFFSIVVVFCELCNDREK